MSFFLFRYTLKVVTYAQEYTLNLVTLHIDITMFRVYNNLNIKQNNPNPT